MSKEFWKFVAFINFPKHKNPEYDKLKKEMRKKYSSKEIKGFEKEYNKLERAYADKWFQGSYHDQTLNAISIVISYGKKAYEGMLNCKKEKAMNNVLNRIIKGREEDYFSFLFD